MVWPKEISPFQINYNKPSYKDKRCCNYTDSLYENLKNNRLDILLDDRDEECWKKIC